MRGIHSGTGLGIRRFTPGECARAAQRVGLIRGTDAARTLSAGVPAAQTGATSQEEVE